MSLPRLLKAEQLTEPLKLDIQAVHTLLRGLPDGIVVRFGRRIRVNEEKFLAWLDKGGTAAI